MARDLPAGLWPRLYRLATGDSWPPTSRRQADTLAEAALREGLLPLLAATPGLPEPVHDALASRRALVALSTARTAIQQRVLDEVLAVLGSPVILLKGADYARRLYASPDLRPMADMDLLVQPERFSEARDRLLACGFEARYPAGAVARLSTYHEAVLVRHDAMIEVHQAFTQRERYRIDYDSLWERAVPAARDTRALRLCDPDALAYQALSMACDELSVPLLRHVDLWLLLRRPEALSQAVERVRAWHARRAFYGALRQLERLLPGELPPEAIAAARNILPRWERVLLDACVITGLEARGDRTRNRLRWVSKKLLLLDDTGRRVAFVLSHAWTLLRAAWHARSHAPSQGPGR